jgi:hypothetical protein
MHRPAKNEKSLREIFHINEMENPLFHITTEQQQLTPLYARELRKSRADPLEIAPFEI